VFRAQARRLPDETEGRVAVVVLRVGEQLVDPKPSHHAPLPALLA